MVLLQQEVLIPTYMKSFTCIGSACEDSCCIGWGVTLDKKTYKNYKSLRHPVLSNKLNKSMKRVKNETGNVDNYAHFIMDSKGRCPMLEESGLCGIQAELGEQSLSPTCTTYPRAINKVGKIFEMSAKLSCPEIARLALLNSEGIEFEHMEYDMNSGWGHRNNLDTSKLDNGEYLFWDLRVFTIEIIQNRNLYLSDRMIFLGLFLNKLQSLLNEQQYERVPALIEEYKNKLNSPSFISSLSHIQINIELQLQLALNLIEERNNSGGTVPRYNECYSEMLSGFDFDIEGQVDLNKLKKKYMVNHNDFYKPFMNNYGYMIENYLVNYIFENLFPNTSNGDVFNQFMRISVLYTMLRIHLVGISGFYKDLNPDLAIKVIQSFVRVVEHNQSYLNSITELLQQNGLDSMAHITTLLKD